MTKNTRPPYSTGFKLEAAQIVVDGNLSIERSKNEHYESSTRFLLIKSYLLVRSFN